MDAFYSKSFLISYYNAYDILEKTFFEESSCHSFCFTSDNFYWDTL